MTELQKKIKAAFELLRKIPVVDEDVDRMAAARSILNDAFRMAGETKEDKADG